LNIPLTVNLAKPLKKDDLKHGITLANLKNVKKSITYKEITIAIGILVALVIALTLWIHEPGLKFSGYGDSRELLLNSPSLPHLFRTVVGILPPAGF